MGKKAKVAGTKNEKLLYIFVYDIYIYTDIYVFTYINKCVCMCVCIRLPE